MPYAKQARWRAANQEKVKAIKTRWKKANRGKVAASNALYYAANSKNLATARAAACARRRAAKLDATPKDQTAEEKADIVDIYKRAKEAGLTVDHCVPLHPCRVCGRKGLHVSQNLVLLDARSNLSKGNRCHECYTKSTEAANAAGAWAEKPPAEGYLRELQILDRP